MHALADGSGPVRRDAAVYAPVGGGTPLGRDERPGGAVVRHGRRPGRQGLAGPDPAGRVRGAARGAGRLRHLAPRGQAWGSWRPRSRRWTAGPCGRSVTRIRSRCSRSCTDPGRVGQAPARARPRRAGGDAGRPAPRGPGGGPAAASVRWSCPGPMTWNWPCASWAGPGPAARSPNRPGSCLAGAAGPVRRGLDALDRWARARFSAEGLVITHGEPHPGNVIRVAADADVGGGGGAGRASRPAARSSRIKAFSTVLSPGSIHLVKAVKAVFAFLCKGEL